MSQRSAERTLLRNKSRVSHIVEVASRYGYAEWVAGSVPESLRGAAHMIVDDRVASLTSGERMREAFTELGTTFIKIGQILSTRPDIVGPDTAAELAKLQADVPANPSDEILAEIEQEFGKPASEVFAEFDEKPLASASIAQVHAAVLHDGTGVVVKIQHPGIDEVVQADGEILDAIATIAEHRSHDVAQTRPTAVVADLRRSLEAELDFLREANNLTLFRNNFADEADVVIPKPYGSLTTRRVLVMSRLDGERLTDGIDHLGDRGDEFIKRGAEIYVEMIFRDGVFHADPHPGNIVLMGDGRIGILDFGKTGRLDDELQTSVDDLVLGMMVDDLEGVVDALLDMCGTPPGLDRKVFRADVSDWLGSNVSGGLDTIDVAVASEGAMGIIHSHHLVLPGDVALLIRVLVQLQGLLAATGNHITLAEVLEPAKSRIAMQRYSPQRIVKHLRRTGRDWERLVETAPRQLTAILDRFGGGNTDVSLGVENLDRNVNRLATAILAASLFSGSSRLWAAKVPPKLGNMSAPGAIGTIGAAIIATRILRAANRSGGL